MASARIQRWALTLSAYDYHMQYKPGKDHGNADMLPLPGAPTEVPLPAENKILMESLQDSPIGAEQVRRWTDRDPTLAEV